MTQNNKICFIFHINEESTYQESIRYLQEVLVPEGFETEVIELRNIINVASSFNEAMRKSNAKYKVYLNDNVLIVNKNFINCAISNFTKNPNVGIIGMLGTNTPSLTGKVESAFSFIGNKYIREEDGKLERIKNYMSSAPLPQVKLLDGKLLVTQYDIAWREDIVLTSDYLGESQSLEFIEKGFHAAVVKQDVDWFLYEPKRYGNKVDSSRELFLTEYYSKLFPKVSVLIPTYNRPVYFEQALQSVINQTYKNLEIVVCDDSTNDETANLITKYLENYDNIFYIKNPSNLGQFRNDLQCMDLSTGEFINFLMDDDLFHPTKIERMMNYYLQDTNGDVNLITSHRHIIDSEGRIVEDRKLTKKAFEEDTLLEGVTFGDYALKYNWNFIGEPTTVLFRKSALKSPFGTFCGREYGCNVDMASWLTLLTEGKAIYISDTLSYFREHSNQQLQSDLMKLLGAADYAHELLYAPSKGFLKKSEDMLFALEYCLGYTAKIMNNVNKNIKNHTIYFELLDFMEEIKVRRADLLKKQMIEEKNEIKRIESLMKDATEEYKLTKDYGELLLIYEILNIKSDIYESEQSERGR